MQGTCHARTGQDALQAAAARATRLYAGARQQRKMCLPPTDMRTAAAGRFLAKKAIPMSITYCLRAFWPLSPFCAGLARAMQ
jgi:hypothetical protein